MSPKRSAQSGFSLVELMIAMVVTLIISGAIYGLLAGGQNAFRREPALTDRQQQIRAAMDIIQRDLATGGQKMGTWFQNFTPGLNGVGPAGPSGATDFLQVFGNDGMCPDVVANPNNPNSGDNVNTGVDIPSCYQNDSFVLVLFADGSSKWGFGHNIHAQNTKVNFPGGLQPAASMINGPGDLKGPPNVIAIGL